MARITVLELRNVLNGMIKDGKGDYIVATWIRIPKVNIPEAIDLRHEWNEVDNERFVAFYT